jgi:hypothetical protein
LIKEETMDQAAGVGQGRFERTKGRGALIICAMILINVVAVAVVLSLRFG